LFGQVGVVKGVAPAPEALIIAFGKSSRSKGVSGVEQTQPRSHLALGVAYAEAGVTAEAEREFQELASENEGSADAQRLLQSLRSH